MVEIIWVCCGCGPWYQFSSYFVALGFLLLKLCRCCGWDFDYACTLGNPEITAIGYAKLIEIIIATSVNYDMAS